LPQALSFLRLSFVLLFMGQLVIAMATGLVLRLLAPGAGSPDSLLAWMLVILSVPHLPLALALSVRGIQGGNRGSALSATLLTAVLLSTPAWFLSLAMITGQQGLPVIILMMILAGQYAIGMVMVGRFARLSLVAPKKDDAEAEDGDADPAAAPAEAAPGDGADSAVR
jgi:hypothetical protein